MSASAPSGTEPRTCSVLASMGLIRRVGAGLRHAPAVVGGGEPRAADVEGVVVQVHGGLLLELGERAAYFVAPAPAAVHHKSGVEHTRSHWFPRPVLMGFFVHPVQKPLRHELH